MISLVTFGFFAGYTLLYAAIQKDKYYWRHPWELLKP